MTWAPLAYLTFGFFIGYVLGKIENHIREVRRAVLRLERELRRNEDESEGSE